MDTILIKKGKVNFFIFVVVVTEIESLTVQTGNYLPSAPPTQNTLSPGEVSFFLPLRF